mmetsp:Transcript_92653/g.288873  ORF Transcript_92653/g.288873 Transcript_92653/m.288873 type:complete len:351 (+) Transcript_92653:851-1903(+)
MEAGEAVLPEREVAAAAVPQPLDALAGRRGPLGHEEEGQGADEADALDAREEQLQHALEEQLVAVVAVVHEVRDPGGEAGAQAEEGLEEDGEQDVASDLGRPAYDGVRHLRVPADAILAVPLQALAPDEDDPEHEQGDADEGADHDGHDAEDQGQRHQQQQQRPPQPRGHRLAPLPARKLEVAAADLPLCLSGVQGRVVLPRGPEGHVYAPDDHADLHQLPDPARVGLLAQRGPRARQPDHGVDDQQPELLDEESAPSEHEVHARTVVLLEGCHPLLGGGRDAEHAEDLEGNPAPTRHLLHARRGGQLVGLHGEHRLGDFGVVQRPSGRVGRGLVLAQDLQDVEDGLRGR